MLVGVISEMEWLTHFQILDSIQAKAMHDGD